MRVILVLLFAAIALPALAQDADIEQRRALAREYVELTTADAVMGPMIDAMWPAIEAQMGGPGAVPTEILPELKAAFTAEIDTAMEGAMDEIAGAYADEFTLDDLTAILAFYRSAPGQKAITVQPVIMNRMLPVLTARLQASLPGAIERVVEEASKRAKSGN